jgi:hypothetical protein
MILQLSEAGAPPTAYTTPAEFRLALDKNEPLWPDSGVLVCTASVIRSPLATNALKNTSPPSLLIVDDVTATGYSDLGRALQALATRAHQIIFTDKRAEALFPPAEVRTWTFPLIDGEGQLIAPEFSVLVHEYPGDPAEAELVREAIQFLRKVPYLIPSHLFTRTAIQSELLKYARSLEKPEQLSLQEAEDEEPEATQTDFQPSDRPTIDTIWRMLDQFDDLSPDGRLLAVIEEVRSAFDQGLPVVVSADLVQEVDYLAAAIEAHGLPVSIATASMRSEESLRAAENLRSGAVLLATSAFFADLQRPLPNGTRSLWFNPPRNRRQVQRRLGLGMRSRDVRIVLFRAVPAVTPADENVESLLAILQDPWHEPGILPA